MSLDLAQITFFASLLVSGLGIGLWLMSWFGRHDAIRKQRLMDCGLALVFAGVLARVVIKAERTPLDWALGVLAVVFIAASLWRLTHTQRDAEGKPE